MNKPIGLLISEYHEEKRNYQTACNEVRDKAVELGMDPEFAKDVTKAISFLDGYRANRKPQAFKEDIRLALDLLEDFRASEAINILVGLVS